VRLRYFATSLHSGISQVALASVSNDESAFVFAVDSGRVEIDGSGELILRVNTAAMGEKSGLHRFSYQIVAHVSTVAGRISGTIRIPSAIREVCTEWDRDPDGVRALFVPPRTGGMKTGPGCSLLRSLCHLQPGWLPARVAVRRSAFLTTSLITAPSTCHCTCGWIWPRHFHHLPASAGPLRHQRL